MTIEEKAKEYRSDTFRTPFGYDIEMAFSEGANWMLEKAMALIEDSVIFDKFGRPVKSETFRKAMEE